MLSTLGLRTVPYYGHFTHTIKHLMLVVDGMVDGTVGCHIIPYLYGHIWYVYSMYGIQMLRPKWIICISCTLSPPPVLATNPAIAVAVAVAGGNASRAAPILYVTSRCQLVAGFEI